MVDTTEALAHALTARYFDTGRSFQYAVKGAYSPFASSAVGVADFTDESKLEAAINGGTLPPGTGAVMYDSEDWAQTPAVQQHDPATYYQRAADAAHAAGLLLIAAPATNLAYVLAPNAPRNQKYDEYLLLGIPAAVAQDADVYVAQAQGLQADTPAYASFVQAAASQASSANPNVEILSGLSTNPNGVTQTASQMLHAAAASTPYVSGWWLNDPHAGAFCPKCTGPFPETIVRFLRGLPRLKSPATRISKSG
jgi:hypothetical protein